MKEKKVGRVWIIIIAYTSLMIGAAMVPVFWADEEPKTEELKKEESKKEESKKEESKKEESKKEVFEDGNKKK